VLRTLARIVLGFMLLIGIAAGSTALFLHSSLPQSDGALALPGLEASVSVSRDRLGIPTIVASSEHDADFALGFVHAQDRLFSMDMMRRYGAGRLSEWFGARTVPVDRAMRTFGLYRAAAAQYAALSQPVRAALDAYAAGVNAYLATRTGALPPEYYLLGARPEPWQPADSLVWGKIMDLELTGNFRGELLRARLLGRISPDDLAVLYPPYSKTAPVVLDGPRAMLDGQRLDALAALLPPGIGPQAASNNWVLDGAHSQSGKPLLANDPHLDFSAPGVWYLARIETPGMTLAGVTAPGAPFLIIGHSDRIAWGFTTTGSDVEDLFVEKPDPADPARYLAPDGARPFVTREERIAVRGGADVTLTVRETRHGPVISDLADFAAGGDIIALQTTWLGADDRTPQAIWEMSRARDWAEFRAALRSYVAPQQNIVYADVDGTIGFIAPALVPIRASGDGWLPSPGWNADHDWIGAIPFDALPTSVNPATGRFVSANNKIVPDDYPYFLTRDWELPYRAERIAALLDATPRQSPDTSAAIQADQVSLAAKDLLRLMLAVAPASSDAAAAVALLTRWDGRMGRDAAEPLVFTAWLRELNRALLATKLGPAYANASSLRPNVTRLILSEHKEWCGAGGDCGAALAQSLERALGELKARYGADSADWRWGGAHRASFASPIWSQVPLLGAWFDLAIAAGGADDTVDAGAMALGDAAQPFLDRHGPSLRMIVDLAAPGEARFMVTPGQSGNPLSPHWGDLLLPWRDVDYVTFGADAGGGVLTLTPRSAALKSGP
jgi:penicillin G amidase